jgi:uncharacterized cupin superfamily protein
MRATAASASTSLRSMAPEAQVEQTGEGLVAKKPGWFVVNARGSRWYYTEGRSAFCDFEGDADFEQVGLNIQVFEPGVPMSMYHWEKVDEEDFLVIAGEAIAIVEGEERPLRQWDFLHCPPGTKHTIVGAGDGPCVVVAVGGRGPDGKPDWGGYSVDAAALRHGAGVERETANPDEAYAHLNSRQPAAFREDWLPK